jgi:hypothetical protein
MVASLQIPLLFHLAKSLYPRIVIGAVIFEQPAGVRPRLCDCARLESERAARSNNQVA